MRRSSHYYRVRVSVQQVGADCRLWTIVHACVLTLSVCWFADRSAGSNKCFGLACLLLSSAFLLWVVWTLNFRHLHGKYPSTYFPRPEDKTFSPFVLCRSQYFRTCEHVHALRNRRIYFPPCRLQKTIDYAENPVTPI